MARYLRMEPPKVRALFTEFQAQYHEVLLPGNSTLKSILITDETYDEISRSNGWRKNTTTKGNDVFVFGVIVFLDNTIKDRWKFQRST